MSKGKRLLERVKDQEGKLAESVPKTELDALRSNLENKITQLEGRLSESISRAEAEARLKRVRSRLKGRIKKLEEELAESVPRAKSEARIHDQFGLASHFGRLKDSFP